MAEDKNPAEESESHDLIEEEAQSANEAAAEEPASDGEPRGEQALAEEITELKDQLLRSAAEMENVRRRAQRDVENAHKYAVEKLINELFPVIDSLEKAVETAVATDGADAIAEGVGLSLKLFTDTLAKAGVEQIDPLGEPFDPQVHEAMTMVPNPDAEPNSIMDVMQKGYVLNGRVVRAAKVIVVKGSDEP
jgi:molecular chaperone GrpE